MSPVFWREQVQQGEAVFLMQITAQHPQITSLHPRPKPGAGTRGTPRPPDPLLAPQDGEGCSEGMERV